MDSCPELVENKAIPLLSIPLNGFMWREFMKAHPLLFKSFNSIEWILHHHGSCSVWKALSSPLYGFYPIKPPSGGSTYMM
jgi:hypothetical protein